ncbi:phosphoribosylaminoimidazolecarboxamide formyltransferase / IMP cyclohydrolase [Desulfacinum hydrothermale DSM 13146]|uniref:Phosphoribosylaminoimidazolecarboxamide formyltransferase / IMP cyclohydrolase n=1 Tax=Desulfacinum hydrothermale DSM 13146 TaxID=1121390 RepID=A0A1W1XHL8_9BACT|nr:IMP cyclohydrolase [Desulfacinum hydrothermale]SMC23485.1 phosphoribosylaminoimidazolecarboxamide formyltransferase / IMP cyclohydrolase [Desulfacinum hydrothermale DSM 13146]
MTVIKRALVSVTDKSGVVEFAQGLARHGVKILSTGGTAKMLRQGGLQVEDVSDFTGFPEILDGRVKTLHPKIHGGILARRDLEEHRRTMAEQGIEPIDMVVVNLYAFEQTVAKPGCTLEEAIENIDIGGPTLIRAAAKNNAHVAVVTDPADYEGVLEEMERSGGSLSKETRLRLAAKAFCLTHGYDGAICSYLKRVCEGS